jgi:hypothetical protein
MQEPKKLETLDDLAVLIQRTIGKDVASLGDKVDGIEKTMATKDDVASVERNLKASIRGVKNRLDAMDNNLTGLTGASRELIDVLDDKQVISHSEAKAIKQRHLGLPA